jgi:hypothetical protein
MSFKLKVPGRLLWLVLVAAAPLTLNADQIPLSVEPKVDPSIERADAIAEGFKKAVKEVWEFESKKAKFQCVGSKNAGAKAPGLKVVVQAARVGSSIRQADVEVTVSMTFAGKEIGKETRTAGGVAEADDRVFVLPAEARAAFEELVRKLKVDLCNPKATLKGKSRMEIHEGGANGVFNGSFEGSGPLPIEPDGSFSAAIPVLEKNLGGEVTMTGGSCHASPFESRYTAVIAGAYDSTDGSLRLTTMRARDRTSTASTMSCVIAGRSFTAPAAPNPAGDTEDVAAGRDIRIAFRDGVPTLVPLRAIRGVTQELSIELSFREG